MKRVAILGATGYIGKSLLFEFLEVPGDNTLFLFSRSVRKMKNLIKDVSKGGDCSVHSFDEFSSFTYDVIINCTGVGDPSLLQKDPANIFTTTEEIDSIIISYLFKNPKTLYINISSGAVYGDNFKKPCTEETNTILHINSLNPQEYYSVAKIYAEAKHRSLCHLHIVDIRVFAFFSSFVDVEAKFLMSEIAYCIQHNKIFTTNDENIIRDYSTPKDLFALIQLIMVKKVNNDAFDIYSKKVISKFDLLSFLEKKYKLKYEIIKNSKKNFSSVKKKYFSKNKKAESIGYVPKFTSLQGIEYEIDKLLKNNT